MSLIIPFIIVIISIIHQIYSIPKFIFSLYNDHHDYIGQLLNKNCSSLNEYSPLFICSNEIFYYIQLNIDISLVPYQSQFNKCGIIIKYNSIPIFNQSSFFISHNNNQNFIEFKQQSILSIDNTNWNKTLMIIIYNNINKNNYCSLKLFPIGSNCSLIFPIKSYNVSCYLNMIFSKYNYFENNNKYLSIINKTKQYNKFNENLFAFLITIFILTISSLILLIGNIIYIEQIQNNIPNYLKYYNTDSLNE